MSIRLIKPSLLAVRNWPELVVKAKYQSRQLAKLCGVSHKSLERFFRQQLQTTPQCWLDEVRLFEAERLARSGRRTKEIAALLHYSNSSHFCHHFKRKFRMTAGEWRAAVPMKEEVSINCRQ